VADDAVGQAKAGRPAEALRRPGRHTVRCGRCAARCERARRVSWAAACRTR